jgi:serine/threonine-protein kinase
VASEPGRIVGSYQLEGVLGRGGMGVVYRARDLRLGRPVALKLLADHAADDPRFRDRFLRERRAATTIDHPNVLPVYEAGEVDGELYIAMRLVDGEDLESLLRREGPLLPPRAGALLAQIADALDAIHAHGLVHRDVKPSNVLIHTAGAREHAYVTDFGIAKLSATAATPLTETGAFMGTVDYCAPEVIRGAALDARADVYSLGCVLFECLTGEKPFARDTQLAIVYAHLEDRPPSVQELRPGLPVALDAVVARALAKDAGDRYDSAGALADAAVAAIGSTPPTGAATVPRAKPPRPARRRGRPPGAALAALGVGVAAATAFAVALLSGGGGGGSGGSGNTNAASASPAGVTPAAAAGAGPSSEGRSVVGSPLTAAPGDAGYCTDDSPGSGCTVLQLTLGNVDQAVRADGVITGFAVRGAKGRLALRVIDGRPGRRRVVARGPTVRATGDGVERFSVRVPVARGQRVAVEQGTDGYLPFRWRDEATRVDIWNPALTTTPTPALADASAGDNYEYLYNATIEPDDDHDGFGDLTQDPDHGGAGARCPQANVVARGSGSSVIRVDDKLFGCRQGVRTEVGPTAGAKYRLPAFAGDQLAVVRVADGRSSILIYDLGDRRRAFATAETSDDNRPADWTVTDLVVAPNGDAAWMAAPRGAPDRTGLWTRKGGKVQQMDSGKLRAGSLRLGADARGVTYTDTGGRERDSGF